MVDMTQWLPTPTPPLLSSVLRLPRRWHIELELLGLPLETADLKLDLLLPHSVSGDKSPSSSHRSEGRVKKCRTRGWGKGRGVMRPPSVCRALLIFTSFQHIYHTNTCSRCVCVCVCARGRVKAQTLINQILRWHHTSWFLINKTFAALQWKII